MKKIFLYISVLLMISCNDLHNKKGVELAMKQYDHLIKKMDIDSIALLYTPDGDLGSIAHGRDSIKRFLATFKDLRVLSQSSVTSFIEVNGDTSIQKGAFRQTVLIHEKDTVKANGEYTATWLWIPLDGWHIKRMMTKPAN